MFSIQLYRNTLQGVVCMLLSVVIVSAGLTGGAVALEVAEQNAVAAFIERA